jgi:hypothetical protein
MRRETTHEARCKPRMSAKERRKARKARRKKKKKQNSRFDGLTFDSDADEWDSIPSSEDMFETYMSGFLHEPDLMYGYQYGVDLDEFCGQIDPLKQFQMMREIGTTGMI